MNSILSIALSGMQAAATRLNVSAQNVANANSDGPLPDASATAQTQYPPAYAAQTVNQVETAGGGTQAIVSNAQPGTITAYDPTAPFADANGNVAAPNVDYTNEAIQQVMAQTDFAMNAQVVRVYSEMMRTLLNIGKNDNNS